MIRHQRLWGAVDGHQEEYTDLLRNLVGVSRLGQRAIQDRVAERLAGLGCAVEQIPYQPRQLQIDYEVVEAIQRPEGEYINVIGVKAADGPGRSLLFFAHPDSEPLTDLDVWTHDPFAGEVVDGRLYGWGVADDLLGVATMIGALDAVVKAGLTPQGTLTFASTPSKRHAQGIVAGLDRGFRADAAVYLHPAESGAGLDEIKAITSGLLHFCLTIEGRPPATSEPGHTAFAHQAVNPLDKAWPLYQALRRLDVERGQRIHDPVLHTHVGRSTNLLVSYLHSGDGERPGRIPATCTFGGTVSFPPGETLRDVQGEIEAAIQAACDTDPWLRHHPPRLEWVAGVGSAAVRLDDPLYRTVHQAIAAVTGREPRVNPLHTSSDIRNPILHSGIPTVGIGSLAGSLSQNGCHD